MTMRFQIVGLAEEIKALGMIREGFAVLVGCDTMTIYRACRRGVSISMALAIARHLPDGVIIKSPDGQFLGEYRLIPARPNARTTWADFRHAVNGICQFIQEEIEGRAVS